MTGIYSIIHLPSKRVYVGSAIQIARRWDTHLLMFQRNVHDNIHLQRAWNLYGSKEFAFQLLEQTNKEELIVKEQEWIDKLDASNPKLGFNLCPKAGSRLGKPHSIETIEKIRAANTGRKHRPETIEKMKSIRGSDRAATKLTEEEVVQIKYKLSKGRTHESLGKEYGVHRGTITAINRGVIWGHIG